MQIKLKLHKFFSNILNYKSITSFILSLFIIISSILFNNVEYNNSIQLDFFTAVYITFGVMVGTSIGYFLLEYTRLRTLITLAIILATIIIIPAIFASQKVNADLNSGEVEKVLFCAIVSTIVHIGVSRFGSLTVILSFILPAIFLTTGFPEKLSNEIFLLMGGITLFLYFLLLFTIFQFRYRYQITSKEGVRILQFRYLFITLITISISVISIYFISERIENTERKAQERKIVEKEMQDEEERNKPIDPKKNDLIFEEREKESDVTVVGYYKADEPAYLKIDIFNVEYDNKGLQIKSASTRYSTISDFGIKPEDDTDLQSIQVVYRPNITDQHLPSAGAISYFEGLTYSRSLGIFKSNNIVPTELSKIEYWYSKDLYEGNNPDLQESYYGVFFGNSYSNIFSTSERFDEIYNLAFEVTADSYSIYDQAKAIEQYLKENYQYSYFPEIEDQVSPIDDFLLDSKKGYCTHFATSMVYMMEALGYDARLVGGYYADAYASDLNAYVITSDRLHAWVEVYIDGNWVMFDPTSSNIAPDTEAYFVTGRNGEETLSWEEYKQKYNFDSVVPTVSFDTFFKSTNQQVTIEKPFDFNDASKKWQSEDSKKREEEKNQKEKVTLKTPKIVKDGAQVFIILLFIIILIFGIRAIFIRAIDFIRDRKQFKQNYFENRIRKIDKNVRVFFEQKIKNDQKENKTVLKKELNLKSVAPAELISTIAQELPQYKTKLIQLYKEIDLALYSGRELSRKELKRVKVLYKELIKG